LAAALEAAVPPGSVWQGRLAAATSLNNALINSSEVETALKGGGSAALAVTCSAAVDAAALFVEVPLGAVLCCLVVLRH